MLTSGKSRSSGRAYRGRDRFTEVSPGKSGCRVPVLLAILALLMTYVAGWWHWYYFARPVHSLSGHLHLFRQGDRWEYLVTSKFTLRGITIGSTRFREVTIIRSTNLDGLSVLEEQTSIAQGATEVSSSNGYSEYFNQDQQSRIVSAIGDSGGKNNAFRRLTHPVLSPGIWTNAYRVDQLYAYSNGDTVTRSASVNGTEVVSTPTGRFTAWRVQCNQSGIMFGKQSDREDVMWYCPQLGAPVKQITRTKRSSGTDEEMTYVLNSTNVNMNGTDGTSTAALGSNELTQSR